MARRSLKIRGKTARRFERFSQPEETQTETLRRLLDEVGASEVPPMCDSCGEMIAGAFVRVPSSETGETGETRCMDCSEIDATNH